MQRYDLRHLHDDFYDRMGELIEGGLKVGEVGIFLFEVGDFSSIQKSADFVRDLGHELMNSLKFNEVDWTIVVKKLGSEEMLERQEAVEVAEELIEAEKIEAQQIADEKVEAKAKADAEKAEVEVKESPAEETSTKVPAKKKPAVNTKAN